jgi:hypothetical protein
MSYLESIAIWSFPDANTDQARRKTPPLSSTDPISVRLKPQTSFYQTFTADLGLVEGATEGHHADTRCQVFHRYCGARSRSERRLPYNVGNETITGSAVGILHDTATSRYIFRRVKCSQGSSHIHNYTGKPLGYTSSCGRYTEKLLDRPGN